MDRITASLLKEFVTESNLGKLPEDQRFEHFTAFLCIQKHYSETVDTSDLVIGKGGDTGIDAIAILVNGSIVTDSASVLDFANSNGYLDVTFVFIQSERSSSFDTSKVGQFAYGVSDFFSELPKLARNAGVTDFAEIMSAVYASSSKFKHGKPKCRLYYATTGKYQHDQNLEARKSSVLHDLEAMQIFEDIDFQFVGADEIQRLYNQSRNAISREFIFSERTTVPEIPGVKEAYLGLVPASEFRKLLVDDNGNIIKSLFYDNVRDWQDFNPVNSEMRATLDSPDLKLRFALMNNGVTIIAKSLVPTGDKFVIEDYQIVNGCQTSHVLYHANEKADASVRVPLRLISTQDEQVITSIIKATNRQTEVKTEQLLALSDFQRKLEQFFQTYEGVRSLFYERRSKQFAGEVGIEKTRVVTMATLVRSFAAMFLEEPHRTSRNYSALLDQVGKTIFIDGQRLEPYYVSAYALYQLEYTFRNQLIDSRFKVARYQILLVARLLIDKTPLPKKNSHDMGKYCDKQLQVWWNLDSAIGLLQASANVIEAAAGGSFQKTPEQRDQTRTVAFTEAIKKRALAAKWKP